MEDNDAEDVADEADESEAGDEDALNRQLQPRQLVLFSLHMLSPTAVIHFAGSLWTQINIKESKIRENTKISGTKCSGKHKLYKIEP